MRETCLANGCFPDSPAGPWQDKQPDGGAANPEDEKSGRDEAPATLEQNIFTVIEHLTAIFGGWGLN